MGYSIDDIKNKGYSIQDISNMFDQKVGIELRAAVDNVPSEEVLEEILKTFDETPFPPEKEQVEEETETSEDNLINEEDEKLFSETQEKTKEILEKLNETPEPVDEDLADIIAEDEKKNTEPVFIQMDSLQEMAMFKKFEQHVSKTYQVILPNSGGIATVKPIPLASLDALNNSSLFSDFEYYKMLLTILFDAIVDTTLPSSSFEEFIGNINIFDIDEILFGVYKLSYGDNTDFSTTCSKCNSAIDIKINLEDIKKLSNETKQSITNILNGSREKPDFSRRIEVPELEGTIIEVSLPTLKKQIEVNTFLEQKGESVEGSVYKYLLHINFIGIPVGNNEFHKYSALEDIYKVVDVSYTNLTKVSQEIDTFAKYFSGFVGEVKCPSCGTQNPINYDIKTDFLIKALNS